MVHGYCIWQVTATCLTGHGPVRAPGPAGASLPNRSIASHPAQPSVFTKLPCRPRRSPSHSCQRPYRRMHTSTVENMRCLFDVIERIARCHGCSSCPAAMLHSPPAQPTRTPLTRRDWALGSSCRRRHCCRHPCPHRRRALCCCQPRSAQPSCLRPCARASRRACSACCAS